MITELISAIQFGVEAGKFAEGLYNGEHFEDVDRAYDIYSSIDFDGNYESEIQNVLSCLSTVSSEDRLFVKVAAWNLQAWCYAHLGQFAKSRQYISRVLNASVDSLTVNKEGIREYQRQCRDLQKQIKSIEHPEQEQHQSRNKTASSDKKEGSRVKRDDLLVLISWCDKNNSSYTSTTKIRSSPKELRIALQDNGISLSTSELYEAHTYGDVVDLILSKKPGQKDSNHTSQKKTSQPIKYKEAPDDEILAILRECSGEYHATEGTRITDGIRRFMCPNLKDWYSISIPDSILSKVQTFGDLVEYLHNGKLSSKTENHTHSSVHREDQLTVKQSVPKSQPSINEQEYIEMFNEYAMDGEISERDRRMLDKFRSRLGISEDRARVLEASCKKLLLTEEEQEYLEMYKEYAADGEISERDRKMLNKMRDMMGISEERAKELERYQA